MAIDHLKGGKQEVIRRLLKLEKSMSASDRKTLRIIRNILKKNNYRITKKVRAKIIAEFNEMIKKNDRIASLLESDTKKVAVANIIKASGLDKLSPDIVNKIVDKVTLDKLSTAFHPSLNKVKGALLKQLKTSITEGEGVVKLAKKLQNLEGLKVSIPQHIREIERAARKAITDPTQFKVFKRILKKHERYINSLTREGADGFQHLGIRGATRKFAKDAERLVKDLEKASFENLDNIVTEWAGKKALNAQKVVARTETSKAYNEYIVEYAKEAEHIIGIEVYLSSSHDPSAPETVDCGSLAGFFLFTEHDPDSISIPPHHPNCICGTRYMFSEDAVPAEQKAA